MGAKQRAQQRGKKAAKGSMKGQPMSQKQINQSTLMPDLSAAHRSRSLLNWNKFSQSSSTGGHNGFSMSEEAMNTDRRAFGWGSTPLRTQTITFISAGHLKREEDGWNTVSEEEESPQKQSDAEQKSGALAAERIAVEEEGSVTAKLETKTSTLSISNEDIRQPTSHESVQVESAIRPSTTQPTQQNGHASPAPNPTINSPSSPTSDSEEEIVFAGRGLASQQPSRRPTPAPPPQSTSVPPSTALSDKPAVALQPKAAVFTPSAVTTTTSVFSPATVLGLDSPSDVPTSTRTKAKGPKEFSLNQKLFSRKYDEDELMQDYIDNMALDDSEEDGDDTNPSGSGRKPFKKTETFRMFNGDGLENAKVQTRGNTGKQPAKSMADQAIDWDSDDLADFDDLSTTDEEVGDVSQVLRYRTRVSGPQYLVVANGTEASDAKWMLHSKLISETAVKEIQIYEEIRQMNIEEDSYDEDEDEDEDSEEDENEEVLQDLIEDIDSEDDENARIMKYTARMTDEQIARVLAKQEELGLGSDELLLFNGEAADDDELEDVIGVDEDFIPFSLGKHTSNRGRSKRNKKHRDSFPPAEAFADALEQDPYGVFDIMDFERPSLRPTKKGRKSDFPWDLDGLDDEIRNHLANTWTKDREKKAERKRQKEEARLNASLEAGENSDPAIIKTRIRQFLVQDVTELRLPPMESALRAAVHRLAKALKLNSRSEGKEGLGIGRYPILTKTPRTPHYTIQTIWEIDALMNTRKFFPKSLIGSTRKTPRTAGSARRRVGGGGVMAGATYREGEEVGGSAPEIGAENRGRAMLEKMGWSAGMGIGAEGNKGSLNHVRHIVKTTKAGLG